MKKSICWITSGYLLQVDLSILHKIKEHFNVKWIVYAQHHSDMAQHALSYARKYEIEIIIFNSRHHRYNPLIYLDYVKQMRMLSKMDADIYYFNIIAFPYLIFAIKHYIPSQKVVMAMHHGKIHNGMQLRHLYKYYLRYLCKQDFYFQYFSESQAKYFTGDKNRYNVIPLALNDFGHSNKVPAQNIITFLSFGNIIETKNIGLLIQAAEEVKKHSNHEFKVKIVGHCRNWEHYQQLIKHPEIFDLHIERVSDLEIPDLFASANYLVLPYKSVTQSGPLRIAYGYNTPVITSDLDGFKESVVENVTGLMFKTENVKSLAMLMQNVIENHPKKYLQLKEMQKRYVDENLKVDVVVDKYIQMFNSIINNYEIER